MDRNLSMGLDGRFKLSLSARRAWIEICVAVVIVMVSVVALRKESVDRNQKKSVAHETFNASLSARRAWIEICSYTPI